MRSGIQKKLLDSGFRRNDDVGTILRPLITVFARLQFNYAIRRKKSNETKTQLAIQKWWVSVQAKAAARAQPEA